MTATKKKKPLSNKVAAQKKATSSYSKRLRKRYGKDASKSEIFFCEAGRCVKLATVPEKENQYRPHLIRRYGLLVLIVIIAGLQFGYSQVLRGGVLGQQTTLSTQNLLASTNAAREKNGDKPLTLNTKLSQAAQEKAKDMFTKQYWAHNAPDGTPPWKWIMQSGYSYSLAGENLARGFSTSAGVVNAWMNSTEHRANLLNNNYTDVGMAVVSGELDGKETSLVVAMYADPATNKATVAAAAPNTGGATFTEAPVQDTSILTRFSRAIQSMTPVLLVTLMLLAVATVVAVLAHFKRNKLPKKLRGSWYRGHAIYKVTFFACIAVALLLVYGGGQI